MIRSVLFVDCAAGRAPLARVARIDEQHRDTGSLGFVGDERLKLSEGPVSEPSAMLAAGLGPSANVLQVFQPDAASGALRLNHESLRNAVVFVFLESLLFAREFTKSAFGSLATAALKSLATIGEPLAGGLDSRAAMRFAVAVRGEIDDTKINAEHLCCHDRIGLVDIADTRKIECAAHEHQIDFALAKSEKFALALAHHGLDLGTSAKRPDRDDIVRLEADDAVIIGLRGVLAECALNLPVQLVGVGYLRDTTDSDLRGEAEALPDIGVTELVQVESSENTSLKTLCRQVVAGGVASLKRVLELLKLLGCRAKFDVSNEFHFAYIEKLRSKSSPSGRHFLRHLKEAVSMPQDL